MFATVGARSEAGRSPNLSSEAESVRLTDSPLVAETADWLGDKTKELGSLLSSDRAVEYVAILRAFSEFRRHHEPEPLHEDIVRTVCGEMPDPFAELTLKNDLRQLKDWGLVTERIEKERLRGYRGNRRTKFRYRLCDEAAQFIDWLDERRNRPLDASGGDIIGNLLDLQCSLLHELRRKLRTVTPTGTNADTAGDVLCRVEQLRVSVDATARTLQALNLRLLSFGAESFSADEAKPVVDKLALFLDRFGRRFGVLREEIVQDLTELRRPNLVARWATCADALRVEASKFRHIASMRIPDATAILFDAVPFYGIDAAWRDQLLAFADDLGLQLFVSSPDQDGVKREIRHSVSLIAIKDENIDVHLSPIVWRNVATQGGLFDAPTDSDVGMKVLAETNRRSGCCRASPCLCILRCTV